MPTCQNCNNQWSWKQAWKKTFTLDTLMICPYCGEKQYVTSKTMNRTALYTLIIITLITVISLFFGLSLVSLLLWISSIPLFSVLYPFWLELSNKKIPFNHVFQFVERVIKEECEW